MGAAVSNAEVNEEAHERELTELRAEILLYRTALEIAYEALEVEFGSSGDGWWMRRLVETGKCCDGADEMCDLCHRLGKTVPSSTPLCHSSSCPSAS